MFASAATVIAALFCLTLAKVNGTAGLGPIGAMGVACAGLSMLTLLPALLTIFGRRAFWPFVPHTPGTAPTDEVAHSALGTRIAEGSKPAALAAVVAGVAGGLRAAAADNRHGAPAPLRRPGRAAAGCASRPWSACWTTPSSSPTSCGASGTRNRPTPRTASGSGWAIACRSGPGRVAVGSVVLLLVLTAGLAFFSTGLTTND